MKYEVPVVKDSKYVCRGNECCCFGIDGSSNYMYKMEMIIYGSGDIGDVLVKAECRIHSDTEISDDW